MTLLQWAFFWLRGGGGVVPPVTSVLRISDTALAPDDGRMTLACDDGRTTLIPD